MSKEETIVNKLSSIDTIVPEDPRFHKIYGAHVYWAKKPANIVAYCIENLSFPGDIVLDPFAGVGVVPIEALRLRRKGIGIDLCPLAVFIMEKSVMPCDESTIRAYKEKFSKIKGHLWGELNSPGYLRELYRATCPVCSNGGAVTIESRYDCLNNEEHPRYRKWKLKAIKTYCEKCNTKAWKILRGSHVKEIWEKGRSKVKMIVKKVDSLKSEEDFIKGLEDEAFKINPPNWKLLTNTRINVHEGMTLIDIYTKRNLLALSAIKKEIYQLGESNETEMLKYAFSCNLHRARMTDYKRASPQNYYIPKSDMTELNVWISFEEKIKEVEESKRYIWDHIWKHLDHDVEKWNAEDFSEVEKDKWIMIKKWDAKKLNELIPKRSIQYVHTDPPYADQVPYFEVAVPWIAWLELESEQEWLNQMKQEVILSDSPERPEKLRTTTEGIKGYSKDFFEAFTNLKDILLTGKWLSVWYCCSNEDYWRALTDHLNKLGFERIKSQVIVRAVTTFKQVITKAKNPLAAVREQELLRHYKHVEKEVPIYKVPLDEAVKLFLDTAIKVISAKGEATTGEIIVAFLTRCLDTYDNPPPDYDYVSLLKEDRSRFEVITTRTQVGKKEVEEEKWKLKGLGQTRMKDWFENG